MDTCDECGGTGHMREGAVIMCGPKGGVRSAAELNCTICRGSGRVNADWRAEGRLLRDARVSRDWSSLEFARIAKIAPSALSDMEHGRVDPSPLSAIWAAISVLP